jgi:hypothetical protein
MSANFPSGFVPGPNTPVPLVCFNKLQAEVYELLKVDHKFDHSIPPPTHLTLGYFEELIFKSIQELQSYLATMQTQAAAELAYNYAGCVTFLSDHVNMVASELWPSPWTDRIDISYQLRTDLIDLVAMVHQYWGDTRLLTLKVPDASFDDREEKPLRAQLAQLQKHLRGRQLDQDLAELVQAPFITILDRFDKTKVTWQLLYYSKQLMERLLAAAKKEKLSNDALQKLLMENNFNHPTFIQFYVRYIQSQLNGIRDNDKKKLFLQDKLLHARLWQEPEYQALYTDKPNVKDLVLPALEGLLGMLQLQDEMKPAKKPLPARYDLHIIAWFIRMWKEIMFESNVNMTEAADAFAGIFSIKDCAANNLAARFRNESYELDEASFLEIRRILNKWLDFLEREWKRIQAKKPEDTKHNYKK